MAGFIAAIHVLFAGNSGRRCATRDHVSAGRNRDRRPWWPPWSR